MKEKLKSLLLKKSIWKYAITTAAGILVIAGSLCALFLYWNRANIPVDSDASSSAVSAFSSTPVIPSASTNGHITAATSFPASDNTTNAQGSTSSSSTLVTSSTSSDVFPLCTVTTPEPPAQRQLSPTRLYGGMGGDFPVMVMENGDVYRWLSDDRTKKQAAPGGEVYATCEKIAEHTADYLFSCPFNGKAFEMILEANGDLYARGYIPSQNVLDTGFPRTGMDFDSFFKDYTRWQQENVLLRQNVKQICQGMFLTNNGEVYLYGTNWGQVIATPKKILTGVTFIAGKYNDAYAILTGGELLKWDGHGWRHFADHARYAATDGQGHGYYISENNDLYIWCNEDGACPNDGLMKLSSVPRKLGENVKEAQVSVGYAYLTYDNRLFALGGDILTKNTQHLFVPDGHCIANNVQSFSFPGTIMYTDSQHRLHTYGENYNSLRCLPNDGSSQPLDTVLLSDIKGFTCSDGWAMALANNGEMYTWGANNVGLYIDDWSQAFVIDKPLRIHPISG